MILWGVFHTPRKFTEKISKLSLILMFVKNIPPNFIWFLWISLICFSNVTIILKTRSTWIISLCIAYDCCWTQTHFTIIFILFVHHLFTIFKIECCVFFFFFSIWSMKHFLSFIDADLLSIKLFHFQIYFLSHFFL